MGDSFTAGELAESRVGWYAYVPGALARRGVRAEAISIALAGSTTRIHVEQLRAWRRESGQRPTHVVLISGANNWDSLDLQRRFTAAWPDTVHPLLRPLYLRGGGPMFALHWLGERAGLVQPGDPEQVMVGPAQRYWYEHPQYEEWLLSQTRGELAAFAARTRDIGAEPVFGSYVAHSMSAELRAAATALGVRFFDEQGPDDEQRAAEYREAGWLAEDDWHLNDAGHRVYADRFARWWVGPTPATAPAALTPTAPTPTAAPSTRTTPR